MGRLFAHLRLPSLVARRIQSVQAHVHRLTVLGCTHEHDHPVLEWADRQHELVAEDVLNSNEGDWLSNLGSIVRDIPGEYDSIDWCYPCTHFGHTYGLNRLLATVLVRYISVKFPDVLHLHPRSRLYTIECHHPPFRPRNPGEPRLEYDQRAAHHCHDQEHTVRFSHQPDCRRPTTGRSPLVLQNVRVLILRNGTDTPPADMAPYLSPVRRHLLPFGLIT